MIALTEIIHITHSHIINGHKHYGATEQFDAVSLIVATGRSSRVALTEFVAFHDGDMQDAHSVLHLAGVPRVQTHRVDVVRALVEDPLDHGHHAALDGGDEWRRCEAAGDGDFGARQQQQVDERLALERHGHVECRAEPRQQVERTAAFDEVLRHVVVAVPEGMLIIMNFIWCPE